MNAQERMKTLLEYSKLNASELADRLGVRTKQAVYDIISGKTKGISENMRSKIMFCFPEINAVWLMTGEGEMLKSDTPMAIPSKMSEGIPLLPISAMAGALTDDVSMLEYECEFFKIPTFRGADFLIQAKGDSMQPRYFSGDILACKRVPMDDLFFQWGKAYVLDTTQGPLVKKIDPGSDKEHVLIVSENERYKPFELPVSTIRAVALVIGVIRVE